MPSYPTLYPIESYENTLLFSPLVIFHRRDYSGPARLGVIRLGGYAVGSGGGGGREFF
jgi:hypothetical protein